MTFRIHNTVLTLRFGFFAVLAVLLTLDGGVHVLPALLAVAVHETGHILAAKLCGMQINRSRSARSAFTWRGRRQASAIFVAPSCRLRGRLQIYLASCCFCRCRVPILPCSSRCSRSTCCPPYRWTAAPRFTVCCAAHLVKKRPSDITVSSVLLAAYPRHARVFGFDFYGLQLYAFVFGGLHLILLNSETAGEHVLKFPRCSVIIK